MVDPYSPEHFYQISLLNPTTVTYISDEYVPLGFDVQRRQNHLCPLFEAEITVNDECTFLFKIENNNVTISFRGIFYISFIYYRNH